MIKTQRNGERQQLVARGSSLVNSPTSHQLPATSFSSQPRAGSATIDKYFAFQLLNDRPKDQMTQGDWLLWGELASAIAPFLMADLVELKRSSETYAIQTAARIKYLETRLSNLVSDRATRVSQVDAIGKPADLVTAGAGDARQADTMGQPADLSDPEVPPSFPTPTRQADSTLELFSPRPPAIASCSDCMREKVKIVNSAGQPPATSHQLPPPPRSPYA